MNQKIKCIECGYDFVFSDRDQAFYEQKGFNSPKRCRKCRVVKKERYNNNQGSNQINSIENNNQENG